MGYKMQLESNAVYIEHAFFSPQLLESTTVFEDGIVTTELYDVSLNQFHFIHGRQTAQIDSAISIDFDTSFCVTHFVLNNTFHTEKSPPAASSVNTYSTYHQDKNRPETGLIEANQEYEFLELACRQCFLKRLIDEDQPYSDKLYNNFYTTDYASSAKYPILPSMLQCIQDIKGNVFTGSLQQLYLETKAAELFLLQVQALHNQSNVVSKLKPKDIEYLHEARLYIERHYQTPCTIIDLARIVGINQTKLKSGFRELFGTTVFGYLKELQMEKARQLLQEEKLYVSEVADQLGYKHPQHFAAAFKRKFGILPSELK